MAKGKAFQGDGAERFFSLGDVPAQKVPKKRKKAVNDFNKLVAEKYSGKRGTKAAAEKPKPKAKKGRA